MSIKTYFSKRSNYLLIILILFVGISSVVIISLNVYTILIPILSVFALLLVAIRDMKAQSEVDTKEAEKKITDEVIVRIDDTLTKENQELKAKHQLLEDKQKIMKDFLQKEVIKNDDLLQSISEESFMVLYHYNLSTQTRFLNFLPNQRTMINDIIAELGFVSVGSKHGAPFFHVVNTALLPKELQKPAYLEAYIRKKVLNGWKKLSADLKKHDESKYDAFQKLMADNKINLAYFLGKLFVSETRIGYLNYPLFSPDFLPYISGFAKKVKNVNKQKLREIISAASLSYFIEFIPQADRDIFINKENEIKDRLNIKELFDYQSVSKEKWLEITKSLFSDEEKAQRYAEGICGYTGRYLPIIREFL